MNIQSGYCTNVHAGADLAQTRANLQRYAVAVKERFSPDAAIGIGLWLSASSARELLRSQGLPAFADWLGEQGLVPFTLNGFPFGDFHQQVVKHQVYLPTWYEVARAEYTYDLITILHGLLPAGQEGSISTLPIVWGNPKPDVGQLQHAAAALVKLAQHLADLEKSTGRLIHLCLEPEPGCYLQRSTDVVRFFEEHLLPRHDEDTVRRHLRICHDICHAAVMFEDQEEVLQRYRTAGLLVGKIQVSSAVALALDTINPPERPAALQQLAGFNEPRYLHQTMVRTDPRHPPVFFEDLHLALASDLAPANSSEWHVHFHVPIYVQRFGFLQAMQSDIVKCLRLAQAHKTTGHFEVETYAWGVLPADLQQPDLAAGIAEEMRWFRDTWTNLNNQA
jgi:hypothetical protein